MRPVASVLVLTTMAAGMVGASCGRTPVEVEEDREPIIFPLPPPDSLLRVHEWQAACSPDGRLVAYSHEVKPGYQPEFGQFGIYFVEVGPDSVSEPSLVAHVSGSYSLSFAPDSRRVTYNRRGDIWVADLYSKEVRRLTTHYSGQKPSWHPQDERIAYTLMQALEDPADSGGVRILDVDTLEDRPIHTRNGRVLYGANLDWDPAGESVIYTRYAPGTGGMEVFRVFPDSSEEIQVTDEGWDCSSTRWCDGGTAILLDVDPSRSGYPDFPGWWVIGEDGEIVRPFFDQQNQIEVGSNLAVGPGPGEFVVTRPAAGNEHYLALWIVGPGEGGGLRWRQITGPKAPAP